MTVDYRVGDTREVIKTIPDGSVDLIASSPPFLALRSYVPADHHAKADEIGSEANPAEFIDMLLGLTAEWGRVLAPHGSIAIELGDTYSGSGGAGGDYNQGGLRDGQERFDGSQSRAYGTGSASRPPRSGRDRNRLSAVPGQGGGNWPRAKSLALIPQLYAVALAYGINPLTGQPSPAGRWLVRNVIVWHRPNPAVGALGDKVRPSTSYIVVATRSAKRWFDLTAVRMAYAESTIRSDGGTRDTANFDARNNGIGYTPRSNAMTHAGAPPLDAWFDEPDSDLRPRRIAMRDHRRRPDIGPEPATLTTYIVIATRSPKRWFDLTAVRGPSVRGSRPNEINGTGIKPITGSRGDDGKPLAKAEWSGSPPLDAWFDPYDSQIVEGDADPGNGSVLGVAATATTPSPSTLSPFDHYDGSHDTWTLTTQPSRLAHYAMWPAKLAERLILMMCPREVCDALVCKSCGHTHELRNSHLNAFTMGADEQQLPLSPTLQEDLRRVRDVLRGPQSVDVQQTVSVQAGPTETRETLQLQGWSDQPQGLHPSVDAELPLGDNGERVRARTPLRDGTTPGTPAREARTRPSQERREGRQSAGEPAGDDERDASWRGDLPELRSRLLDSLTCPCGNQGFAVCGEPRRRMEGAAEYVTANGSRHNGHEWGSGVVDLLGAHSHKPDGSTTRSAPTLGWSDCGHDNYRPGLTLDPFAGSGTTLAVADLHGRDAIGIDFDARNKAIYPARYDEVKRALFGTPAPMPGQETFDFEVTA